MNVTLGQKFENYKQGKYSLLLSAAKQALKLRMKHNNTIKAFMFKFDEIGIHSLCNCFAKTTYYIFIY